ncbi:HAD-IC family P-type ATPase [Pseudoxanthomonas suwonensis]|uniref:Carbonate dehydratase n=1 Tax=Pseudoxanthomonas suwonensis TaxID=314722 RepID=A0A0E3UP66_9GAMM|nr:HAD-IC family P-type ATPase [Pseudoxanthomonas suwonensis]AKC87540.1 carbonate dehydratase [Pseudoxanthomonas suwonensis]
MSVDPSTPQPPAAWHALDADEVLRRLHAGSGGLSDEEAADRLVIHGRNVLPAPPTRSPLRRFLEQFNNALILFLLSAAVLAGLLGHRIDAAVIVAVVLVNAVVGFVQEGRAEQALAALQAMLAPTARVLRDGVRREIDVAGLVPGDTVLLEAGDRVPADVRLLHARGLLVDEAALTGESVAAEKTEVPVAEDASLGDRTGMAYSGTLVAAGQGRGVVVATASATEIGRINTLIGSVDVLATPLLRQINRFGRRFTAVAIAAAALLFVFAVFARDYAWLDALMVVVALAVGVVPEGLPAVITITLAIGVRRMATRHAIVRRLPAVETLGATSVICSDKTGTLTRNEMTARHLVTAGGTAVASGGGYSPEGALALERGGEADAGMRRLVLCGLLCNDAELRQRDGHWQVDGDPMEGALLALALKAGFEPDMALADRPRLDAIPFDASYRYMATLHRGAGETAELYVKGAPEQLLALSTRQLDGDGEPQPLRAAFWESAIAEAASRGERVLGFAMRTLEHAPERLEQEQVAGLLFLGVVGFIDPPRAEAMAAVADCRSAGIAVKMITGDHAATAAAIARQLGLAEAPVVVEGRSLDGVADAELPALAAGADVFARASPEHKLRVVRALQSRGAVVAMTGDGVNDAPSLKQADVGIAMGRKGTEAAKEAAEMVLSDDNFASIVAAVHEGRTVYDNIRKVVAWTLPTNGGEILAIVIALLLGMTLPMTPAQILWINMVLTVTLGLVLAFEPAEPGVMRRPPRPSSAALVSPFMLWRIVLVSLLFTAGALGVFIWAIGRGLDVPTARTLVVNTLCVMEIFYLFNVRYLHMTSFTWRGARGTPAVLWAIAGVVVAQLAFTYAPFMQRLFDSRPVALLDGVVVVLIGVVLMVVLELEKALLRRLGWFEELALGGARAYEGTRA